MNNIGEMIVQAYYTVGCCSLPFIAISWLQMLYFVVPLSLDAILQELRGRPYPQLTTEQVLNALMRLGCKADSGEEEKLYSIGRASFL